MRHLVVLAILTFLGCATGLQAGDVDFASQIQPILAKRCYPCHGPDDQQGGVRFDQRDTLLVEADSGKVAIAPGDPDHSEMFQRITADDDSVRMPPEGKPLSSSEIDAVGGWIVAGAAFTKHWSFQPIGNPTPPSIDSADEAYQPLDLFVLKRLRNAKVAWAGQAEPAVLVRRAYLDITGLPPSPEELQGWVGHWSDQTYERMIDQLLANPSFGDRWARMWLDVVRYAESNSFERDNPKPNAWRYRDYVIEAFNRDKPYDQFIREQIAGDELEQVTSETLIATGFYRLGIWDDEPADPLQARFDEYDDLVTTTGQAILALTVNCARCHDHKIDPIKQRDYYSMVAFMRDVTSYADRSDQVTNNQLDIDLQAAAQHKVADAKIRLLKRKLEKLEQKAIVHLSATDQRATEGDQREQVLKEKLRDVMDEEAWDEYTSLKSKLQQATELKHALPERVTTLGLAKVDPQPPTTFVLNRGSPHNEGEAVVPAFPELMGGEIPELPDIPEGARSSGRRKILAQWLAADDNWLSARVIVNRIWLHYFGRGIVRSPNNFGLMGDPPTHPELLDFLASELIRSGWSLKLIHRQILLSASYRRSSQNISQSAAVDPNNQLFWRQNLKRLSAEQVRDSALFASGQLNLAQFGPPMYPTLSAEVLASQSQPGRNWEKSSSAEQARRSIYIHVKRSLPVPMLSVFDFPETDTSCEARFLTVQPGQALTLLNSQWMQEQAQHLLERVQREVGNELETQAARCLQLVTSRQPTADDVAELTSLVDRLKTNQGLPESQARHCMALVALNLNEFVYLD